MITGLILRLVMSFLLIIVSALPVGNLPVGINNAFTFIFNSLYKFSDIIPVSGIMAVLAAWIAFELAMQLFRLGIWLFNKFRGISGSK